MNASFYLSYARADASPQVKRFFDDLCDTIRIVTNLPRTARVGFYEESQYELANEWSFEAQNALQTSQVMVCLLSPAYFYDTRAGKEWQVFNTRWRQMRGTVSLANVIKPISWDPWEGSVPLVVSDLLATSDRLFQSRPLKEMLSSSSGSLRNYAEIVKVLAQQLIEMPASDSLPILKDLTPLSEPSSLFHLWADADVKVTSNGNAERLPPLDTLIKNLPLHINVTLNDNRAKAPVFSQDASPSVSEDRQNESAVVDDDDEVPPTRVFIIEDNPSLIRWFSEPFEVSGFLTQNFEKS
ncbi:MAG TPA: hypothetical protein VN643_06300 [Pyrinomonadaceae bacterium]|nr:hypothetical protein [Pyrinomonadaceae bacterium]